MRRSRLRSRPVDDWDTVAAAGMLGCVMAWRGGCSGRLDPHHVIAKRYLRDLEVQDPRNIVPLCRHHHDNVEAKRFYLEEADLPAGFHEFADELGRGWMLPQILGPRVMR